MGDVQEPQAGVGGAYTAGNNPRPGGKIETDPTPPYEGRSKGPDTSESTRAKTESVERQLEGTEKTPIGQTTSPGGSNIDPATGEGGQPISQDEVSHRTPDDPYGAGTSASVPGEKYGKPATEHQGPTQRPVGQVEGDLMDPDKDASGTRKGEG